MGLIKAGIGAVGGVMADQWKEFFYCEALDRDILVKKGTKVIGNRSSNTKGSDNIISNGSGIAVADGQCMLIVDQGKVVEVCAEPGEFTYDSSTEPTIFAGKLGPSILETFKAIGKRFSYGGDTGKDQRVYYINTKEIMDNKFGTPNPIPFRVVDSKIDLDVDVSLRCSGVYSYKIEDPLLFYTNVCANVKDEFTRSEIDQQLKTEFVSALAPSFSRLSALEIRPNAIPGYMPEMEAAVNEALKAKWAELRGIKVVSVAMNVPIMPEEDQQMLKDAQHEARLRNPGLAAAHMVGAQAEAMKTAAGNQGGAMLGFMGMNMAQAAGGMNAGNLFAMDQQNRAAQAQQAQAAAQPQANANSWTCACGVVVNGNFCPQCGAKKPEVKPANAWTCACGATATGKFCPECGMKKPEEQKGWTCVCGEVNLGKFCAECGARKPEDAPLYKCDKCGWEPEDPKNPPKFCPECGDIFDDSDKQ